MPVRLLVLHHLVFPFLVSVNFSVWFCYWLADLHFVSFFLFLRTSFTNFPSYFSPLLSTLLSFHPFAFSLSLLFSSFSTLPSSVPSSLPSSPVMSSPLLSSSSPPLSSSPFLPSPLLPSALLPLPHSVMPLRQHGSWFRLSWTSPLESCFLGEGVPPPLNPLLHSLDDSTISHRYGY